MSKLHERNIMLVCFRADEAFAVSIEKYVSSFEKYMIFCPIRFLTKNEICVRYLLK